MLKIYVRNMAMYVGFLVGIAAIGIAINGIEVYRSMPYLAERYVAATVVAIILNLYLAKKEYEQKVREQLAYEMQQHFANMVKNAKRVRLEDLELENL